MPYTRRMRGGSVSGVHADQGRNIHGEPVKKEHRLPMQTTYWKPEFQPVRTGFHTPRSFNPETRNRLKTSTRLMDLCLGTLSDTDPDYLTEITPAEFAVVDMVTGEKGWFEWAQGTTPEQITGMVDSWFNSASKRVAFRLWAV